MHTKPKGVTTIVKEYPIAYGPPYYPVPQKRNKELFHKYYDLARKEKNTFFVGRLARYQYYNMDQCVASALETYNQLRLLIK